MGTPGIYQRVLIVDDDPIQQVILEALLRRLGTVDVIAASDGQAALELLSRERDGFDLMCLDLTMPRVDGIELLRKLQARGIKIPILFVSGANPSVCRAATALAALYGLTTVGILHKPVHRASLSGALYQHATGSTPHLALEPALVH